MPSFSTFAKSFNFGFRPDLQSNQITATRAKNGCCCWNNKELAKELTATNHALSWIQANHGVGATDAEIKSIFQDVSKRKRYYQRITSGFWGWLRGLIRCGTTNRQLKNLAASLSAIQKVVVHSQSFRHSVVNQLQHGTAKQELFKQLQKDFPQLVVSKTPKARDFGLSKKQTTPNVPFLLHKTKNQIEVALAPTSHTAAPTIKKISDLKKLPQVFSDTIESKFTQLRDKKSCHPTELNFVPLTVQFPADKIHLQIDKDPVEGKCTLVAQIEHALDGHQYKRYDLTLDSTPEKVQEWIDSLVNENKEKHARVNQLRALDPDFKVNWQTKQFIAQVTVGARTETFISDGLSPEAFNRVKVSKDNYVQNAQYYPSIPDVGTKKQIALGTGITEVVKEKANGDYELSLKGLSTPSIKKTVAKTENLERAIKELALENEVEAVSKNRDYFGGLSNSKGQPHVAIVDLAPDHSMFINVTSSDKGFELVLVDSTSGKSCSVGNFALSEKIEEIVNLIKQKPVEILLNLELSKQGGVIGDTALQFTLTPQKNGLPLLSCSFDSSKAKVHLLDKCRIDCHIDTQSTIYDRLPTLVPQDYISCGASLCSQAEMDEMGSNSTPFDENKAAEKSALSFNRSGSEWHYQARIYSLANRKVETHETSRPVVDDPAKPAQPINQWISDLQSANRKYLYNLQTNSKFLTLSSYDLTSQSYSRQYGNLKYVIKLVDKTDTLDAYYSVQKIINGVDQGKLSVFNSSSHTLQEYIDADRGV